MEAGTDNLEEENEDCRSKDRNVKMTTMPDEVMVGSNHHWILDSKKDKVENTAVDADPSPNTPHHRYYCYRSLRTQVAVGGVRRRSARLDGMMLVSSVDTTEFLACTMTHHHDCQNFLSRPKLVSRKGTEGQNL